MEIGKQSEVKLDAKTVDPSTAGGFRVIYDRELSPEVRSSQARDSIGDLRSLKIRVLIKGAEDAPEAVTAELTDDDDIHFLFQHTLDEHGFVDVQQNQRLMIQFSGYAPLLIQMLNACIKDPHRCLAVMYIEDDGTARLDFIQNMEYKFVELLSLGLTEADPELVKQHIIFKHFALKRHVALLQARFDDLSELIQQKNPSLMLQLDQKNGRRRKTHPHKSTHKKTLGMTHTPRSEKANRSTASARKYR